MLKVISRVAICGNADEKDTKMDTLLKDFPVITEIKVAWGEMDALQHVNNVVYFRYFETARLDYFNKINLLVDLQTSQIGPVLRTQCRYKLPSLTQTRCWSARA